MPHICNSHYKYNPADSSTGLCFLPALVGTPLSENQLPCQEVFRKRSIFVLMRDCDWNLVEREAHAKDANDDHVPAVDSHQDGHLPRLVAVHEAHV